MGRSMMRIAFAVGVVLVVLLGKAVYDGQLYEVGVYGVLGCFAFAAIPASVLWSDPAPGPWFRE
jgi:hypothetical protein